MTPADPRPAAPEARGPDALPKHLPEYRDVVAALMLPRELTACEAMELADALLAAALRAHPAGEPSDEQIQALQLELNCEPEPNELDGWAWDVCERILRFVFSVRAAPPPEGTSDE